MLHTLQCQIPLPWCHQWEFRLPFWATHHKDHLGGQPPAQTPEDYRLYHTVRWKTNIPANTKHKVLAHSLWVRKANYSHFLILRLLVHMFAECQCTNFELFGDWFKTKYTLWILLYGTKGRRSSTWSMTAHGTTFELGMLSNFVTWPFFSSARCES